MIISVRKIDIIGSRGYPYVYSGYETFVKELSEQLTLRGYEITVYCHKNLFKEYPSQVNGINLVYISTIEKKILSQFLHSFQSMLHACMNNCDVILVVNSANGPFGVLSRLFRKKTVINVDGLEWLRPKWKGFGARYFHWASKMATRFYDVVITDSVEMQKIYEREFDAKSTMISYGENIRESKNPEFISKWGLEKFGYYLVVGRLIPDNNADIIVREFIKSNSKNKLVIVGDVPYDDKYAHNIKSCSDPRVIFTGYVNDQNVLAELYHNCFVYLHGHEFGGTNPTMLKALAYGCAICALGTVFNREMLSDLEYGIYFTKDNGSLQSTIMEMESKPDKLEISRKNSHKRIIENYTWEKVVRQYVEVFETLGRR